MELTFHALADIFPYMEKAGFVELVADIKQNGVHEPIWLLDGKIIDGRHRYKASMAAGVTCPTRDYQGDDAAAFVLSLNLNRRHLNESQRGMVAARLATMPEGRRESTSGIQLVSQSEAAKRLHVSVDTVKQGVKINKTATPGLIAEVDGGNVSINAAAKVALMAHDDQDRLVTAGPRAIKRAAKEAVRMKNASIREAIDKAELEEFGPEICPTDEELTEAIKWESDQLAYIKGLLNNDGDPLTKAIADVARHSAMVANLKQSADAKQGEYKARADAVTYWKGQAEKEKKRADNAEKELKKLTQPPSQAT